MFNAIRETVKTLQLLHNNGYDPDIMVGTYSLRASGAMALKLLMGYKDSDIRKFGHWTSDTCQEIYIHSQIGQLSSDGVAQK